MEPHTGRRIGLVRTRLPKQSRCSAARSPPPEFDTGSHRLTDYTRGRRASVGRGALPGVPK